MLNLQKASKIKYSTISALGTFLVLISATFPFINNLLEIVYPQINTITVKAADNNLAAVLWSLAICFQSTVLVLTKEMKPYLLAYAPVLFSSILSSAFYFLPLIGIRPNLDVWFYIYIIGIVSLLIFVMHFTNLYLKLIKLRENLVMRSLEEITNEI